MPFDLVTTYGGFDQSDDESWSDHVEPGGTGSQIADPLDLFGIQAGADAAAAAQAQAESAMQAQQFLEDQYNTLKGFQQPFVQGGQQAFGLQGALTGLQGPEAQQAAMQQFQAAQQGAIDYGSDVGWSGMPSGISDALRNYSGGIASQDYDNYYNRLGAMAGLGQSSASALGGVTVDQGQAISNAIQAGGDAQVNNALMQGQIQANSLGNLATLGGAFIQGQGARPQQNSGSNGSMLSNFNQPTSFANNTGNQWHVNEL